VAAAHRSSQTVVRFDRRLSIYTLGDFRVVLPGSGPVREATWKRPQGRTLLKFLLTAPGYRSTTEQLIEHLWPEIKPDRGREYLRRLLMHVRRALEPDRPPYAASAYLLSDRDSVGIRIGGTDDDESGVWFDAHDFEALAGQALSSSQRGEDMRNPGNAALDLYQGPFLPHDLYDDWVRPTRQRYHRLWSTLVKRMAGLEVSDRQLDRAHLLLANLVEAVPDDEDAVFRLMIVSAAGGMRGEALRLYQALRVELARTVAGDPGPQFKSLHDAIRTGRSIDDWLARLTN
jgi:DNA-binding SARP family transcriptional activator